MLLMSVAGFTTASFFCGLAPTLSFLIVFRVVQGACGGGLQPISQAILLESFPPQDRGKAMGFWGLGIMGLALGMLFVPLTTISMDPSPNESMGNATSLFNLVRNLGGSIGIAAVSTIQTRREQIDVNVLGAHVGQGSRLATSMLNALGAHFLAQGSGPVMSAEQARMALFAMVEHEASMMSYNTTFRILAFLFLAMIPFVFLLKRPRMKKGSLGAH